MEERPRNGGPDEGMWTSHYLEGMGYKCIPGGKNRGGAEGRGVDGGAVGGGGR